MKTPIKEKINKYCIVCGDRFVVHPYRRETAKCCSRKCGDINRIKTFTRFIKETPKGKEWRRRIGESHRKEKIGKICVICGTHFVVHPYRKDTAKCCSKKCVVTYRLKLVGSPAKGIKWSKESREKLSEALKGKNLGNQHAKGNVPWNKGRKWVEISGSKHWNWKGGISPLKNRIRTSIEYKTWRLAVYRRDWFTCQVCGEKSGDLNAHHIKDFDIYVELRFDPDNGITFCEECHLDCHHPRRKKRQFSKAWIEAVIQEHIKTLACRMHLIENDN